MVGVPWGTKCWNIWLVFLIHPNNINLTHKGRANNNNDNNNNVNIFHINNEEISQLIIL